jgi:4-amino-4-deoxy-L-arabinose transferase-like glycosyltransferase
VTFISNAWERDFWNPNELRNALITRSMEESGDWLVPRLDGAPTFHHPPLLPWLAATSHLVTGLDPRLSYRLPIALAALLGLWLTWVAGKELFDARVGFLAAAIQASTYLYFRRAGWLDDDLLFAVLCQLALTGFVLGARPEGPARWSLIAWAGLALAALAKSLLLAAGLTFGPFILYLLLTPGERSVEEGLRRVAGKGRWLVFVALALPWYAHAALEHGPALWREHFLGQHFEQLVDAPHRRLPYYYIVHLLVGFLPWSLFLPLGLLHGKDRIKRPGERLAIITVLFTLVALSSISSKKPGYALLAWPFAALLIAAGLFETREKFSLWEGYLRESVSRALPLLLKAPLFAALLLAALHFAGFLPRVAASVLEWIGAGGGETGARVAALFADGDRVLQALGLVVGAGALSWYLSRRVEAAARAEEEPRAAFEFACAVLFLFFTTTFFHEGLNQARSSGPFLAEVQAVVGEAPLALYGRKRPAVYYWLPGVDHLPRPHKTLRDDPALANLERFLDRPEEVFLLAWEPELRVLLRNFSLLAPRFHERARGHLGWTREFVLVSNRPGPPPAPAPPAPAPPPSASRAGSGG